MISQELQLDVTDALSTVDSIDAALQQSAETFKVALSDALAVLNDTQTIENVDAQPVEDAVSEALAAAESDPVAVAGDVSELESEIAGATQDVDVAVGADTSNAEAAIDELSGQEVDVAVNVDTGDASAQIDDLGASAQNATGGVDALGGSTAAFGAAAGIADGGAEGLVGVLGKAGPGGAAAAAGVGAFAGVIGTLYNEAVQGQGATDRFNLTLGEFKNQVGTVNVGGLNISLEDLALKLGSTDDALLNANSSLFQLATNSGATGAQAAEFSETVSALAARAVALNPALGDVGQVAESMGVRLARGGRFAAAYGVALTPAEINTRALANTGKASAADLTIFEKSAAAAQIAVEKYGSGIKKDVDEGSKNPIIQQKKLNATFTEALETLGKPLIAPMFELIKEALPVGTTFAKIFADLGKAVLPALIPVLTALTPPLRIFGKLIEGLSPVLTPLITVSTFLLNPLAQLGLLMDVLGVSVNDVIQPFEDAAEAIGNFFGDLDFAQIGQDVLDFFTGIPDAISGVDWGGVGNDILSAIADGLDAALPVVLDFFTALPERILGVLAGVGGTLLNAGIGLITGLWNGLVAAVPAVLSFFVGLPGQILGWVGDTLGTLLSKGADLIVGIVNGVGSAVGRLAARVSQIPGEALSAVGDIASKFVSVGHAIIDGIVNGITDVGSRIGDKISSLAQDALDEVTDFLGIGSPSRVFAERVGKPIAQGIAAGIEESGDLAIAAAAKLAGDVSGAAVASFAVNSDIGLSGGALSVPTSGGVGAVPAVAAAAASPGSPLVGQMIINGTNSQDIADDVGYNLARERRLAGV